MKTAILFARSTLLLLLFPVLLSVPAGAQSTWTAEPDLIYVNADQITSIPIGRLWRNDQTTSKLPLFQLLSGGPAELTAQPATAPTRLEFDARQLDLGSFPFSYLLTVDGETQTVEGMVTVVPDLQPLGGKWPAPASDQAERRQSIGNKGFDDNCNPDRDDLGFYDTRSALFHLCELGLGSINNCQAWSIDPNGPRLGGPLLARMADWDQDGFDEPTLFDPANHHLWAFEYGHCGGKPCLLSGGMVPLPNLNNGTPVWGRWPNVAGTVVTPTWAYYDRFQGLLSIPGRAPISFSDPLGTGEPLAGVWNDIPFQTLALWQTETHLLHYLSDAAGTQSEHHIRTLAGPVSGYAATLHARDCNGETRSSLAVYRPDLSVVVTVYPGPGAPGLHVKVPVDPVGGGGGSGGGDRSLPDNSNQNQETH